MSASDELTSFFKLLWDNTEGLVYLPTRDKENNWKQFFFRWPAHLPNLLKNVQLWSAEGKEVFVSPVLYKPSAYDARSTAKEHVLGSHVLWGDFDGTAPAEWPTEPSRDRPTPSLRVRSSTSDRQHAYWRLDALEQDIEAIETKNRSLAYLLDADKSGWDISQLLRPPGTVNHGYGKEERQGKTYEVVTEDVTEHRYQLDFFDPRPISGGKSDVTWIPPKYQTYSKYSRAITLPRSSENDCLSLQVRSLSVADQTTLWQLDTLVQRRVLMIRKYMLSFCTPTTKSANTPTAVTGTTA